jgi:exopolysaccharide biosynthesis polyprenyl glycosylphosphotransferase
MSSSPLTLEAQRARRSAAPLAPGAAIVASQWSRRDWACRRLLALSDVLSIAIALGLAAVIARPSQIDSRLLLAGLTAPEWVLLFKAYGLYDRDVKRISHSTLDDVPSLFHALVIGGLLLWLVAKAIEIKQLSFEEMLIFGLVALVLITTARAAVRLALRRWSPERVLLIGDPDGTALLGRKLATHPEYGLQPVGVLAPSRDTVGYEDGLAVVGQIEDFEAVVTAIKARRLIVWSQCMESDDLLMLLRRCQTLGVKVSVVPAMFDLLGPSVEVDEVEGLAVLGINPPVLPASSRALKRAMDLSGSQIALVLFSPLLLIVALAIKLDSRGPVFFRQRRIGRGGKTFNLVKFRTMVVDAEQRRAALLAQSRDPDWLLIDDDPRITRVGRFLRFTSLDELPQLWNVLVGDMSLVGPRPLIESEDRLVEEWGRARLDLTPGLTGLWQVLGRTSIPFKEMVKLDYLYVTNWSLWTDVQLVMRTIPAVFRRRGAN